MFKQILAMLILLVQLPVQAQVIRPRPLVPPDIVKRTFVTDVANELEVSPRTVLQETVHSRRTSQDPVRWQLSVQVDNDNDLATGFYICTGEYQVQRLRVRRLTFSCTFYTPSGVAVGDQ